MKLFRVICVFNTCVAIKMIYSIEVRDNQNNFNYEQKWDHIVEQTDNLINTDKDKLLVKLISVQSQLDMESVCYRAIIDMIENVNREEWAARSEALL